MKRRTFKQKITAVILGLIFSFILLEIGIRVTGFVFLSLQEYRNRISIKRKGEYRILCLGDSMTAGQYPGPLEEFLNEKAPKRRFTVIDKGRSRTNSKYIMAILNEALDEYDPDIVIVMTGNNDQNDLLPYGNISVSRKIPFKVYNLGRILWYHITPEIKRINFFVTNYLKKYVVSSWVHKAQRGYDKAEGRVNKGIDTEPKDDGAYSELGWYYVEQQHYDKAERMFKMAIKEKSKNIEAYHGLGQCYLEQKRNEEAEKMFERVIEIDPENDEAYVALGQCYMERHYYNKAERMFKMAIEKKSKNIEAYHGLGWCYAKQRWCNKAEEIFQMAIAINPSSYMISYRLGYCYAGQGEKNKAEEMFKRAIEINPKKTWAYFGLAWLYRDQGEYTKAEGVLKKAIETDPQSDSIHSALGSLYEEQERGKLADTYFQKANELRSEFYNSITWRNYEKLKNIVRRRGIKLVCVQYPMRSIEPLKEMLNSDKDVIFVDNEMIFKKAVKQARYTDYFVDSFGGDFGHCTPRGNRLLAKNIGREILTMVEYR